MGILGKLLGSGDGDRPDAGGLGDEDRRIRRDMDAALLRRAEAAERAGDMKRAQELRRLIGD